MRIEATDMTTYPDLAQNEPRVEAQRRNSAGHWEIHEYEAGQAVQLDSLGISLAVDALYRDPLAS